MAPFIIEAKSIRGETDGQYKISHRHPSIKKEARTSQLESSCFLCFLHKGVLSSATIPQLRNSPPDNRAPSASKHLYASVSPLQIAAKFHRPP